MSGDFIRATRARQRARQEAGAARLWGTTPEQDLATYAAALDAAEVRAKTRAAHDAMNQALRAGRGTPVGRGARAAQRLNAALRRAAGYPEEA